MGKTPIPEPIKKSARKQSFLLIDPRSSPYLQKNNYFAPSKQATSNKADTMFQFQISEPYLPNQFLKLNSKEATLPTKTH